MSELNAPEPLETDAIAAMADVLRNRKFFYMTDSIGKPIIKEFPNPDDETAPADKVLLVFENAEDISYFSENEGKTDPPTEYIVAEASYDEMIEHAAEAGAELGGYEKPDLELNALLEEFATLMENPEHIGYIFKNAEGAHILNYIRDTGFLTTAFREQDVEEICEHLKGFVGSEVTAEAVPFRQVGNLSIQLPGADGRVVIISGTRIVGMLEPDPAVVEAVKAHIAELKTQSETTEPV